MATSAAMKACVQILCRSSRAFVAVVFLIFLHVVAEDAAIVWLHDAGGYGEGFREYIKSTDSGAELLRGFEAAGVGLYFPNADPRSYSPIGGKASWIWFDQKGASPELPEITASVESGVAQVMNLIRLLNVRGVPPNRIVVGGYAMGGSLAMQLVLRHPEAFGYAFVLSASLSDDSSALRTVPWRSWSSSMASWPDVFMAYGLDDAYVLPEWSSRASGHLERLGVKVQRHSLPGVRHVLSDSMLQPLTTWLRKVLQVRRGDWTRPKDVRSDL